MNERGGVDGSYPFALRTRFEKRMNRILTAVVRVVFPPILRLFLGLSVEGEEHLQALSCGAVSVCNHVHPLDCVILACCCGDRPISFLSLKSNFDIPVIGHIIRWLKAVPVPDTPSGAIALRRHIRASTDRGGLFQIYPEGWLIKRCPTLRPFHRGAFVFACDAGVPVLPFVLEETPWEGPAALWHRKPALTLHILAPIYPDAAQPARAQAQSLEAAVRTRMEAALRAGKALPLAGEEALEEL